MKKSKFKLDALQVRFLLSKKLNGAKPQTIESYRKVFMNFEHQIKKAINYDELLQQTADFFFAINWYSNMALNNQRAHINGYFNFLVEDGFLKENPIKELKIKRRKEVDKPRPTNKEDLLKLLEIIPRYSYVGISALTRIILMVDKGASFAEVVRLKRSSLVANISMRLSAHKTTGLFVKFEKVGDVDVAQDKRTFFIFWSTY